MNAARSYFSLTATAFFALFLIASPPHRVHHFFEEQAGQNHSATHGHTHSENSDDHDHHNSAQRKAPDCALQNFAQHAHAAPFQLAALAAIQTTQLDWIVSVTDAAPTFHHCNACPRAPPALL